MLYHIFRINAYNIIIIIILVASEGNEKDFEGFNIIFTIEIMNILNGILVIISLLRFRCIRFISVIFSIIFIFYNIGAMLVESKLLESDWVPIYTIFIISIRKSLF